MILSQTDLSVNNHSINAETRDKMDFSLIIPCYNEEGNVAAFFDEAEKVLDLAPISYEYVFVNDGSSDQTEAKLRELFDNHPDKNITIINFSRNFGKESAIFAGLQNSTGNAICLIDADLQQLPQTAYQMYRTLIANPELDCVCAYQKNRRESKFMSKTKSLYYKIMNSMVDTEFKNGASDFRVFTSKVKDAILSLGEYHRFSKGIFSWVGFNTEFVEYEASDRNSGETKWSFRSLTKYAISGIMAFSTAPLKMASYVGSVATAFSIIYFIVTLIRKFTNNISVDGFTQLVILITFFGGITLTTLGIIGSYIAKIYEQSKHRPIYIAKDIIRRNKE